MIRRAIPFVIFAIVVIGIAYYAVRHAERSWSPEPETIAEASLRGLREQNRLSAFVARYVAVVTATQRRFGLTAQKTLIMPGTVRYEVDLAKLGDRDVTWNAASRELRVVLPRLALVGPQIDLTELREYDNGGLLMKVTDAETALDQANRARGQQELIRQAREPVPMQLAKDATRRAVERSFAMPLSAAGIDADVRVRFADEADFPPRNAEQMDRSRSLREIYGAGGE